MIGDLEKRILKGLKGGLIGLIGALTLISLSYACNERDSKNKNKGAPIVLLPFRITYSSDKSGSDEVYIRELDGTENWLTSGTNATWSPIGNQIAYDWNNDVWKINVDGSGPVNLTNSPSDTDINPSWSPDGSQIAFTTNRSGNNDVYKMGNDGSSPTPLADTPESETDPAWCPNSLIDLIAYTQDYPLPSPNFEIFTMDSNGGNQINRTNNPAEDISPAWSPDGSEILSATNRDGDYEVYKMGNDGSGQTNISNYPLANDFLPAVTPDWTKILFVSIRDGKDQVYIMDINGANQENVIGDLLNNYTSPDWEP